MATYPFLSDEWIEEIRKIRDEHGEAVSPSVQEIKMNQVVTDVPFGVGSLQAHLDSTSGRLRMELGHLDDADVTITLDYDTAKRIFVDQDPQVVIQAFMGGKLIVQGDMAKLLAALQNSQQQGLDPVAAEVAERIKAVTT